MSERKPRGTRANYRQFSAIQTRWSDNDSYGHVNNVIYYQWFDMVVNRWLIEHGFLDIVSSPIVSLVAETGCTYFESVAFPDSLEAGLAVEAIGTRSVRYGIGIFRQGEDRAVAQGHFVHVTVDRATRKPAPIPAAMYLGLADLRR